jgi:precorrin-2 dehydrogenase / sirohydrochlorin ferrochelatase
MPGYPIELDLTGRKALVVGLGAVGRRKAAGLVEAGGRVVGVDPGPIEIPVGVELRAEPYRAEHLAGASLAFAAATAEVNRQVVADARRLGIWVTSASEPGSGDFTLPATWRDGPLTLTVSTSGASPALASALRDRAARALGTSAGGLAAILAELRPEVLARVADPAARRRMLAEAADPRWLDLIDAEGAEATRRALRVALGLDPVA